MLEYQGKYGKAKVMIDEIDETTVSQIYEFLNHEAFTNPIAIMPDTHAGKGAVIGFTMEMTDKVIPNVVGVDIGCGMVSTELNRSPFEKLSRDDFDKKLRNDIPFGTNVRRDSAWTVMFHDSFFAELTEKGRYLTMRYNNKFNTKYDPIVYTKDWFRIKCDQIGMDHTRALKSIGTLGGGNHFIELGKTVNNKGNWITIHTGSRQFGLKIATYWQKKAGKGQLAYLQGDDMYGYLMDMFFAQAYASLNRKTIAYIIDVSLFDGFGINLQNTIETVHNFIDFEDFIIRKGAIRSYEDEMMIVPFNMEDGTLICKGKSNAEWNYSAPHGAGRVFSRKKAKETLKKKEKDIKHRMESKDIFCSKMPLDEVKESYKDPQIIEDAIEPTAEIVDRIKPVLAMKE